MTKKTTFYKILTITLTLLTFFCLSGSIYYSFLLKNKFKQSNYSTEKQIKLLESSRNDLDKTNFTEYYNLRIEEKIRTKLGRLEEQNNNISFRNKKD